MNCIFCKEISTNSVSVEHIIPESLGNKGKTLGKGIVCDKCNNYFATKIEKPLLDLDYFRSLRARNEIKSKKGKIPVEKIIFDGSICESEIKRPKNSTIIDITINDLNFFKRIIDGNIKELTFPVEHMPPPDNYYVSRFLAKVAIEVLAQRLNVSQEGLDYLVSESQFDEIREYARYGQKTKLWPYHVRKIYGENQPFKSVANPNVMQDRLFEYDILVTNKSEYFLVLILKGVEYSINIGGPEIEGYINWLLDNNHKSPLYLK
jgi:hypothetical protein